MVIKYISIFLLFFFLPSISNFCTSITFFIEKITRLPHRKNVAMNFHVSIWNISILTFIRYMYNREYVLIRYLYHWQKKDLSRKYSEFFQMLGFSISFCFSFAISFSIFVVIDKDERKFQVTHVYNLHICS